ncbi:MAG TPA: ABC transporter permease [Candidatus Polarisedimenticolia bacterium]|jgi:peptide/nickel transport system permease protein|nr:ABC transporter permease [Candidatus Polarisedimenticolia bacterium]
MRYILQRLAQGLLVLLGVTTIVFALTFVAGDPVATLAPLEATPEERAAFAHNMGLDRPIPVQYVDFLAHAARGDFGMSYSSHEPAMGEVLDRLPATILLTAAAVLFALVVSVPLGLLAAINHDGWIDVVARFFAFLGQSIPVFLLGVVLIIVFGVELHWLPSSGTGSWKNLVMPAVAVGSFSAAVLARLLRSSLLEVMSQEYIRTAYAKGLRGRVVVVRHALRNAALPFITMLGLQVGFLLSGAVVAETIFAYPGVGRLAVEAISRKDVPVIQSFVVVAAVIVIVANLFVDVVYTRIDPRIRLR